MPFISPSELPKCELFPGGVSGLVPGENLMLSFLEMEKGGKIPEHAHPEEQAGIVLAGVLRFWLEGEERDLKVGDAFLIPGNVVHSALVLAGPMRIVDIFAPPRGDLLEKME